MKQSLTGWEAQFWQQFFLEELWLVNVKNDAQMIEYGKNFLTRANRVPIKQNC